MSDVVQCVLQIIKDIVECLWYNLSPEACLILKSIWWFEFIHWCCVAGMASGVYSAHCCLPWTVVRIVAHRGNCMCHRVHTATRVGHRYLPQPPGPGNGQRRSSKLRSWAYEGSRQWPVDLRANRASPPLSNCEYWLYQPVPICWRHSADVGVRIFVLVIKCTSL